MPTPTLTRSRPKATTSPPSDWTHIVKPSSFGGSRIDPAAFEIRFQPPKKTGVGSVELILGHKTAKAAGIEPKGPGVILRISTDLKRGRLEAAPEGTIGALPTHGTLTIRVRTSGRNWPDQVIEAIAFATIPPINTNTRPPINLDFKAIDGGLEFMLPPSRARRSSP